MGMFCAASVALLLGMGTLSNGFGLLEPGRRDHLFSLASFADYDGVPQTYWPETRKSDEMSEAALLLESLQESRRRLERLFAGSQSLFLQPTQRTRVETVNGEDAAESLAEGNVAYLGGAQKARGLLSKVPLRYG